MPEYSGGCGGRTRTYDLRVMSPTSYQLLYSAIFMHPLDAQLLYHAQNFLSRFIFCKVLSNGLFYFLIIITNFPKCCVDIV